MFTTQNVLSYFTIFLTFSVIDAIWLKFIAGSFFVKKLGPLLRESLDLRLFLFFYLIYALAIFVFAVQPALNKGSLINALLLGGFLGFIAYAAYDLTNLATLKNWSVTFVLVDLVWGTLLTAFTAGTAFYLIKNFIN